MNLKNIFFRTLITIISLGAINAQNSRKEIQELDFSDLEIIDGFTEDKKQVITRGVEELYPFKNLLQVQENIDWTLYFKSLDNGFIKAKTTMNVLNSNKQITFNTNTKSKPSLSGVDHLRIFNITTIQSILPKEFLKTTSDKSIFTRISNPYTNIKNPKKIYNLNSSLTNQGYSVKNVLKIWGAN